MRHGFLICILFMTCFSIELSARDWSKNDSRQDYTKDPTDFWDATAAASECYTDAFSFPGKEINLQTPMGFDGTVSENLNTFPRNSAPKNCRVNVLSQYVPPPLVDAQIVSDYHGTTADRFQKFYDFLSINISDNRDFPNSKAEQRLIQFLTSWSGANALSENIRFSLMKEFRLDYHVQAMLPPMIIAFSDTSSYMTDEERLLVGKWLWRLVSQSQQSQFNLQDNKNYLRHYTALLWGILVGDDRLVDQARSAYLDALYFMRPDGSFPTEVARGGMGNQYQNTSVNVLVTMAAASRLIGEDWMSFEVNGRSIDNAVEWVTKVNENPKLIRVYARSCPEGSFGSIDKPNLRYKESPPITGETESSWVEVYLEITNRPNLGARLLTSLGWRPPNFSLWSKTLGPQMCLFF